MTGFASAVKSRMMRSGSAGPASVAGVVVAPARSSAAMMVLPMQARTAGRFRSGRGSGFAEGGVAHVLDPTLRVPVLGIQLARALPDLQDSGDRGMCGVSVRSGCLTIH